MKSLMRWLTMALVCGALGCVATTSVTRSGPGLFGPRNDAADEEDAPRGLSLSVASIAKDGTVTLDLRNYSNEPFVFAGTPERPRVIVEVQSGTVQSRHTVSPWSGGQTRDVPAGERIQLTAHVAGAEGRVRIGVKSQEFGYVVWTDWFPR